ncbi:MAG: phosphatase PAP2 family protein, partial [Bacteroidota bacterium]
TVPATTGLMRVLAGKHFPTDVITGYAVGGAIGFLVPHLHRKRADKEATSDGGFSWTPSLLPGATGLGMNMSYRF